MKEDKAFIIRNILTVVSLVLIFATAGLLAITTQLKTITFNYHGDVKSIKTLASSVDGFLLQNKIYLGESTIIEPSKGSRVVSGMEIKISSEDNQQEVFDVESVRESYSPIIASVKEEIEAIPYTEEKIDNAEKDRGTTDVLQEGIEGTKAISYIVKSTNDGVVEKSEIGSQVLAEAKNRVVEVGTKVTVSRSNIVMSISSQVVDNGFVAYNIALPMEYQQYAYNICKRYGIDYPLFLAIMYRESGFNPNASSGVANGLCQIAVSNYSNLHARLGITNLFDPYDNMTAGAYMLSVYMGIAATKVSDYQTQVVYALNSYNMGEYGYYNNCYSQGIIDRTYSNNILQTRERLINFGTV